MRVEIEVPDEWLKSQMPREEIRDIERRRLKSFLGKQANQHERVLAVAQIALNEYLDEIDDHEEIWRFHTPLGDWEKYNGGEGCVVRRRECDLVWLVRSSRPLGG